MRFYVVADDKLVEKFMCDNHTCVNFESRDGMPIEKAKLGFKVMSMEEFDACSKDCYQKIRELEIRISI